MAFEAKQANRDAVDRLVAKLRGHDRGDTVSHREIEDALGMDRTAPAYYRLVQRARRRLRDEHSIWSEPVQGVGFLLQTAADSLTTEQKRRWKRARRQVGIGEKAVAALSDEMLSYRERRLKEAALEAAGKLRRSLSYRELREQEAAKPLKSHGVRRAEATQHAAN